MGRITHFDITGSDPEKLKSFYESIFGWKFAKWDGPMDYWLVTTGENGPGINGGLSKRQTDNYVVITMEVDDLGAAVEQIAAKGGKITESKMAIPGVGWYAEFEDPEQNRIGMMQPDESAS